MLFFFEENHDFNFKYLLLIGILLSIIDPYFIHQQLADLGVPHKICNFLGGEALLN